MYKLCLWVNMVLNSAYFVLSVFLCSIVAVYLSSLILEHVYSKVCLKRYLIMVIILNLIFQGIVLWNVKSGVLFYFDDEYLYRRGPLNSAGYVIMGIEVILLSKCYVRNRASVSTSVVRLIRTIPPIAAALIIFQHMYPDLLLNGMFAAITDMVIFASFQSRLNETDSLTNAGNRNSFFQELNLRLAGQQKFQVVLVALKNFSDINQKFSHKKGDEFLYVIVESMEKIIPDAKVFRFTNVELV